MFLRHEDHVNWLLKNLTTHLRLGELCLAKSMFRVFSGRFSKENGFSSGINQQHLNFDRPATNYRGMSNG